MALEDLHVVGPQEKARLLHRKSQLEKAFAKNSYDKASVHALISLNTRLNDTLQAEGSWLEG